VKQLEAGLRFRFPDNTYRAYVTTSWDDYPPVYSQKKTEHGRLQYSESTADAPYCYSNQIAELPPAYDFVAKLPTSYSSQLPAIVAFLENYRPAGKSYQIVFQNII
jgi:hypothetical protein